MYDLNSTFDIELHKKHYTNYLEVVIFPDGHIEYAVPSHQEKLIAICQNKLNVSRDELNAMCPPEDYFDFIVWLCTMSGCVSVWSNFITKSDTIPLTDEQNKTILRLRQEKLLILNQNA